MARGRSVIGLRAAHLSLPAVAALACGSPTDPPDPPGPMEPTLTVELVAEELDAPLHLTAPPGDPRLFVVEQPGRIRVIAEGALLPEPFLDIVERVSSGGERGLLGLAFHPDYAVNGRFFVNYTDPGGDTRVEEYRASGAPDRAEPDPVRLVLHVEQPFANHNGGLVAFGPDGMLYVGMGDGGQGGDPLGHGQDTSTLHGGLLRIDVDSGDPYAIPPDNPLADQPDARGELWAWGLRNPWRFSFDHEAGLLYIADVGQSRWEEVNAEPADEPGLNYGWAIMEGEECFQSDDCDTAGLTLPVLTYGTGVDGCAVIGGHAYRGEEMPELTGSYFYSDWCAGWLRSFRIESGQAVDHREWEVNGLGRVLSLGQDAVGELYVLAEDGRVLRLVPGDG